VVRSIEKPTVPGWYWYRDSEQDKVLTMTHVYETAGHMNAVWPDGRSDYVATMLGSDACSHAARESRGGCFNRRAGLLLDHPPCIASHPSSLVHSHRLLHRGSIVRPTDGTAQHAGASRSCSVEANTSRILRVNVSGV
jgi:hypothetical protein